jgi:hypothetical protein
MIGIPEIPEYVVMVLLDHIFRWGLVLTSLYGIYWSGKTIWEYYEKYIDNQRLPDSIIRTQNGKVKHKR